LSEEGSITTVFLTDVLSVEVVAIFLAYVLVEAVAETLESWTFSEAETSEDFFVFLFICVLLLLAVAL
jgi:hypothetical protein